VQQLQVAEARIERRGGRERRRRTFYAYVYGSASPRRLGGRRTGDHIYPHVDWHSPRVLALAFGILGLCVLDGVLTIALMAHGATEENPFMALFVPHNLGWFAAIKLTLTALSLLVLIACSRMRLLRAIPGESLLYLVLSGYAALIAYELHLLALFPEAR